MGRLSAKLIQRMDVYVRTAAWVGMIAVCVGALVAGASVADANAAPAASHASRTGPLVSTTGGRLLGKTASGTDEFLGIPYAAPPVGALRWRPPQPAAPWAGVRDASIFAPHCPPLGFPYGAAHESELQYLFSLSNTAFLGGLSAAQE